MYAIDIGWWAFPATRNIECGLGAHTAVDMAITINGIIKQVLFRPS